MGITERNNDILGARDEYRQGTISLKGGLDTRENNLCRLISAHGVNADANIAHT